MTDQLLSLRERHLRELAGDTFDVLVVGGGINGAVSAAALAGSGYRVALIDRHDFAGFTSQHSSNLAWGGIKYMENYEFGLVRQLCKSRNQLMRSFPSTVREIRFLTTIRRGFRHHPAMLWLGAWLYWLIGNGYTRTPRLLSPAGLKKEEPVLAVDRARGGVEYSDAYLFDNDARFVFNFIRSTWHNGGVAVNYTELTDAVRRDGLWRAQVADRNGCGEIERGQIEVRARVLVNAAGPFVDQLNDSYGIRSEHRHVFSKGIHLIVDRVTPNRRVLAFFADDGRLFFVIPMGDKTCIGTTDTRVDTPQTEVTAEDRRFVLDNINQCLDLARPLREEDIIAERCGVRPLALKQGSGASRDWLQLSRRHAVDVDRGKAHISIFGGKLTDCINVGEEICAIVAALGVEARGETRPWYGEPGAEVKTRFLAAAAGLALDAHTAPGAEEALSERLWRRYGAQGFLLLDRIRDDPGQAEPAIAGTDFIRAEVALSAESEMIVTLEDFLRRRSKLALLKSRRELAEAEGMLEVCRALFGDRARERYDAYFAAAGGSEARASLVAAGQNS